MDQQTIRPILGLISSYLLGSIPTAYLFGKLTRGIDLRKYGSGNLGATNAFRVLGKGIGTSVLVIDILKGLAVVLLANFFFYHESLEISKDYFLCLTAIAVVCGHNWTIFLKFKGGKGIATTLGVLIGFSILIEKFGFLVVVVILLWLIIFLSSGFVSLASVISSILLPFWAILFHIPKEIIYFLFVLGAFSLIRHKSNIIKLLQKKESRFNTRAFLNKLSKKTFSK